jgi:hypothetical protein
MGDERWTRVFPTEAEKPGSWHRSRGHLIYRRIAYHPDSMGVASDVIVKDHSLYCLTCRFEIDFFEDPINYDRLTYMERAEHPSHVIHIRMTGQRITTLQTYTWSMTYNMFCLSCRNIIRVAYSMRPLGGFGFLAEDGHG